MSGIEELQRRARRVGFDLRQNGEWWQVNDVGDPQGFPAVFGDIGTTLLECESFISAMEQP